jgi:sortase A
MDVDAPIRHTNVINRLCWVLSFGVFALGSWLIGQGLWIYVKAEAAQILLRSAWTTTLKTQQFVKPWPWADTWPVGRLIVPRHGIDQIILADASGRSLAFGPGQLSRSGLPDARDTTVLSGHRDTYFQFLRQLQINDPLYVESRNGSRAAYTVQELTVADTGRTRLTIQDGADELILTTCYPFDSILPGGPLRYVVRAEKALPK